MSPLHSLTVKMWISMYCISYFWRFASPYYASWCWWRPSWKMAPCANCTPFRRCHHAVSWPPTTQWLILDMQTNVGIRPPPTRKIEPFWASAAALSVHHSVVQSGRCEILFWHSVRSTGGPSDTASMWPLLYHFDVDGLNYWLTNTNPNLTL